MALAVLAASVLLLVLVFLFCPRARNWLGRVFWSTLGRLLTRILCGTTCELCPYSRGCEMNQDEETR